MTNDRLPAGRVAIVVGAAGELGRATAVKLADRGNCRPQVATVRPQVGLPLFTDSQDSAQFRPAEPQERSLNTMLDHLIAGSGAMRSLREPSAELVAAASGEHDALDGDTKGDRR